MTVIPSWFRDRYGLTGRAWLVLAVAVIVLIVGAIVLVTVLTDGPPTGTVEGKRYTPAHTTWTTQCQPVGKVTVCHPQPMYVGDEWEFLLRDGDDEGWRDVDQATYDHWQVGQYYPGPER